MLVTIQANYIASHEKKIAPRYQFSDNKMGCWLCQAHRQCNFVIYNYWFGSVRAMANVNSIKCKQKANLYIQRASVCRQVYAVSNCMRNSHIANCNDNGQK